MILFLEKTKTASLFSGAGPHLLAFRLLHHSSARETAPAAKAEVVIKARKLETVVHTLFS